MTLKSSYRQSRLAPRCRVRFVSGNFAIKKGKSKLRVNFFKIIIDLTKIIRGENPPFKFI